MSCYSEQDLIQLHQELLTVLKEVIRICNILEIKCFVTGGTAIGAHYFHGFVKWDDDIDLGMRRNDYERFLKEAPHIVSKGFFLQYPQTEPNTPFYFAKMRKDDTLFVQREYKDINMHHGIYVDIFPFDKIPDNPFISKIHTRIVQYFQGSFLRRQMKQAILEGQSSLPPWLSEVLASARFAILGLVPRSFFYWRLKKASSLFNKRSCRFVDVIVSSVDRMPSESLNNLVPIEFEGVSLFAPGNIEGYLKNHYPKLNSPDMLESLWITHAPYKVSFSKEQE